MFVNDEKTALVYAQTHYYKSLVNKTSGLIKWALARVETPYVACSFGKDSSVMLHLVLQHKPDIAINFLTKIETDLIDDYNSVIEWWHTNYNANINRINYKGWLEGAKSKGIANNMPAENNDSFFVGIRKDESVGRRITLKKDGLFFKMKNGKIRIAPMADWTVNEIATYMLVNNLPVLKAYQREGFTARTTSNIPSKYPQESLARLKDADIAAYNNLIKLLPDAKYFT